ncbi:MAG: ABC transporter ATP-binding protein [Ardenticatenaceae bacterium]|nr:ABC transporter ATP-binding protein [Ardenticatenaceae bacterium]
MSYLILEDLDKRFPARGRSGEVRAVCDVSLQIERGELVTLLGPSGCGKTTTLRLIGGFEFPTSGRILLDGREIDSLPPHQRDMSMVFQSYAIFPHLSVYENIAYGLRIKKLSEAQIRTKIAQLLALTGLEGLENRAPNQLSGGQQQRVALARALVMEPKVLLMDEPLSNLDAKLRESMRTEIRRIQQTLGITSLYVTHDQAEAMTLSDRIVVMNKGRVDQVGTPFDIYQRPATRFVANFIGRANVLSGTIVGREKGYVALTLLGLPVEVPAPPAPPPAGALAAVLVRPEAVRLQAEPNGVSGVIRRTTYLGPTVEYDVEVAGELLSVVDTDPLRPEIYPEGRTVGVAFLNEALYLLPEPPNPVSG